MKKKFAVLALFLIVTGLKAIYADTWALPVEKDYYSENKMFVAHVTPAKKETKPKLEVFKSDGSEKTPLWQGTLGNEGAPQQVFVSDDGKYVVTVNEVSHRVHGGMGDYVIAFYNKAGLIKNYSLEQILHYPEKIDKKGFRKLTRRSVSGRSWVYRPMFFDNYKGKLYFCVWLTYGKYWLAWDVSSGKEVKINDKMLDRWNQKGRLWALEEIEKGTPYLIAYEFLGKLENPDDRIIFENLLSDGNFCLTHGGFSRTFRARGFGSPKFQLTFSSPKRSLAERVLATLSEKPAKDPDTSEQVYYYLGKVEIAVILPKTDKAKEGNLLIYLIPSTIEKDNWYKTPPIHRLALDLTDNPKMHDDCLYGIEGVTPGKYWIKVVWDKAKPHWKKYERPTKICLPQRGDYQNLESPIITVKAGETVENIIIDCTHKVTSGAN